MLHVPETLHLSEQRPHLRRLELVAPRARVRDGFGDDRVDHANDAVDNGVGVQTGTLRVRARLTNAEGRLLPGSVVKVTFRYGTSERAVVVPDLAVGAPTAKQAVAASAGAASRQQPRRA